jgi:hypothetical protein
MRDTCEYVSIGAAVSRLSLANVARDGKKDKVVPVLN